MKRRKRPILDAERKDGTRIEKLGKKEYETRTEDRMGKDGVMETHITYVPPKGTIYSGIMSVKYDPKRVARIRRMKEREEKK